MEYEFKECLEEFLRSDSSDEENNVPDYNLVNKLQEFKNGLPHDSSFREYDLSFIVRAAAIAFLNSPAIQNSYIEKKRNNVYTFEPNFDFDVLGKSIHGSAVHICEIRKDSSDEVEKVITKKVYSDLVEFFKGIRDGTLKDFFQDLTNSKGSYRFDSYDLYMGSRYENELGKLRINWIGDENIPMFGSENGTSAVEFYSTLLLLNRFEKNRIKQVRMNDKMARERTIEWKYSENASAEIRCILYRYPDNRPHALVHRSAVIERVGKYGDALKSTIWNHANQLSSSFTNSSSQLSSEVAGLHFLLFGLEVMRNPSVLIHNMMMLDLIKNKPDFMETIYRDDFIPMGRDGSERASRFINDLYNKHMPHEYSFDISFKDFFSRGFTKAPSPEDCRRLASLMLKKECNLIDEWLKLKYVEEEKEKIKNDANRFYGILKKACKEWYDIDMN